MPIYSEKYDTPRSRLREILKKRARKLRFALNPQRAEVYFMRHFDQDHDVNGDVTAYGDWRPHPARLSRIGRTSFYCVDASRRGETIVFTRESDGALFAVSIYSLKDEQVEQVLAELV